MLSGLNRSLAENNCNIEHVIVVDGNGNNRFLRILRRTPP